MSLEESMGMGRTDSLTNGYSQGIDSDDSLWTIKWQHPTLVLSSNKRKFQMEMTAKKQENYPI